MSGTCTRRLSLVHKLLLLVIAAVVLPLSLQTVRAADEKPAADPGLAAPPTASLPGAALPGAEPVSEVPIKVNVEPQTRYLDANLLANGSQLSKVEKEIELTLQKPVKLDFTEIPLEEVMRQLGSDMGIDIHLDQFGLAQEGISADTPVTIRLNNPVSLRSALNLILGQLHLTFVIEDEVLKVTRVRYREAPQLNADASNPFAQFARHSPAPYTDVAPSPGGPFTAQPGAPLGPVAAPSPDSVNPFAGQPLQAGSPTASSEQPLSTGVWKKIVDSKKKSLERVEALAKKQAVSSAEVEKAKIDYEISVARYDQAMKAVKYNELLVKLAEIELEEAVEKQKVGKDSVTEFDVRKLQIKLEMAKAKLDEIKE